MEKAKRVKEISEDQKNDIKKKALLKLFDEKKVRKAWYGGEWYFSVVDIIGVFLGEDDHKKVKSYWTVLQTRARTEECENQLATNKKHANWPDQSLKLHRKRYFSTRKPHFLICSQLKSKYRYPKMRATDGKSYKTEAIDADSFLLLLKTLSAVKGERMRGWLQREVRLSEEMKLFLKSGQIKKGN